LTTFSLSQFEITVGAFIVIHGLKMAHFWMQKAVETIVYAHIITPLPEEVCIEGAGYILHGSKWHFNEYRVYGV
jgi:hypothetical protein